MGLFGSGLGKKVKVEKDTYNIPQCDAFTEQKDVLQQLRTGDFLAFLHGGYAEQIKAALTAVEQGNLKQGLSHIKAIRPENDSIAMKSVPALQQIKERLAQIMLQKVHNESKSHTLFKMERIAGYLNESVPQKDKFINREKKYKPILQELILYLNSVLPPLNKLAINNNYYQVYAQYQAVAKYLKEFLVRYDPLFQASFIPDVEAIQKELASVAIRYPLAKKKEYSDAYIHGKINDFRKGLSAYAYKSFDDVCLNLIVDVIAKNEQEFRLGYTIEDLIGHFIDYVYKLTHLEAGFVNKEFINLLISEEEAVYKEEHYHKELQQIKKLLEPSVKKEIVHVDEKAVLNDTSLKKEVPYDVTLFAERVSELTPTSVTEEVKKYVIRVYRKNKPISLPHLVRHFGIDADFATHIADMAHAIRIDVLPLQIAPLEEQEATSLVAEALNAPLNGYVALEPTKPEHIPETAEGLLSLFSKAGFLCLKEKSLLKNINRILIQGDPDKTMLHKLVRGLESMRVVWHNKKGGKKVKAIELSSSYRFVVQHINNRDCVHGVYDHDAYMKLLREIGSLA